MSWRARYIPINRVPPAGARLCETASATDRRCHRPRSGRKGQLISTVRQKDCAPIMRIFFGDGAAAAVATSVRRSADRGTQRAAWSSRWPAACRSWAARGCVALVSSRQAESRGVSNAPGVPATTSSRALLVRCRNTPLQRRATSNTKLAGAAAGAGPLRTSARARHRQPSCDASAAAHDCCHTSQHA